MSRNENRRETGARKFTAKQDADASNDFSQEAAENKKSEDGKGPGRPLDEANEQTRQSDGQSAKRSTPNPSTEKVSGAGPALAEHSKDAKAPRSGRQPGAYVKH
ncbi:hypothetical protein [Pseudaminobacter sp. NGMCC 1.201702]|uniref:hypothetical protein n=1 Tax=Pseudaminobacter sp. NGMCC 1.201702 TaxID=3391825 RepID=UPI0039EF6F5B